ncbi:MAG: LamG-like jellyroll fold domain-containing protein, partial [Bacteroidota bacterium]|nr:LamG-like jellyroll fold domain-containing protein [Bacteroidota bacterium]
MKRQQRALFFIFAIIFLGKLSAQIPVTDLKGYWPLEGNANDFSGNNNNGTVNGATLTSDRFNRANAAYQFSNATHTISILGSSTLNLGKPFTMSLWFYNNGSSQTLFRKGGEWGIDLDGTAGGNQRLAFFSSISNGSNIVKFTDYVVQPNKWYHVCAMFDQSTVKIYLDNVLILDEANSNLSSYSSTHQVTMGGYGPEPFYGKIDDVRIYSRALSPSEVASLYNDQPPVTNVTFRDDYPADGLRYCTGATYTTSDITVYGNFNAGNTISVQLLNPNGTLYSTQNVGYNYASAAANTIAIHIPSGVPSGSGYMFKIETSSPASEYIPNQTFEIYALNSPVISNPSPVNFCTGGSVSLNSTCDFSNIVYEWKKDAAPAGGYNNYNYPANYSATTSGYYSVVYYDQNGCTMQSNQVTVNALSNLAAPVITGNTTVCAGMSTTLDAGTGCASYLWSNGATTQTVSVGAGNYSVTVTNSNGCSVTSEITTVTSAQAPVAVITGEITVCPGTTSTLSATAGYTYLWSTGATTESVNVPAGTYSLTVTDTYGCSANQSLTVQNSTSCTAITSAYCGKEFKTTADNIYSNPVSGALSYEFIFDETNTVGQIFRTSPVITRSTNYINLSEVPFLHYNGNYLVRVRVVRSTGTSPWSAACTFTIIPGNSLYYACNSTYYTYNNMNATMVLRNVYGATKYNVTLVRVSDGVAVTSTDYTAAATSTGAVSYPLTSFTGLTYNTEYYSYVKTYVPYLENGVVTYKWSNPVQNCNVKINEPDNAFHYACNSAFYTYSYNNMNATMVLRNVYGATKYNVTLVRVSDGVAVTSTDYTTPATSTSAVSYPLTSFTGLTYNTEYYSYVKTYVPYLE